MLNSLIGEILLKYNLGSQHEPIKRELLKLVQDEINQLKTEHAEEIEHLQKQLEVKCGVFEHLAKSVNDACEFKGYRQAVKDILGGQG